MNHKRKRPKNRRGGCLMCKPHKANGADRRTMQEKKEDERYDEMMRNAHRHLDRIRRGRE